VFDGATAFKFGLGLGLALGLISIVRNWLKEG
jgi:hypothetical protein